MVDPRLGPRDDAGPWRRWTRVLADSQSWLDALTAWIVSITTACVTLTWWAGAVGGLSAWVWDRYLPTDDGALDGITGAGRDALELVSSVGFRVAGGVVPAPTNSTYTSPLHFLDISAEAALTSQRRPGRRVVARYRTSQGAS